MRDAYKKSLICLSGKSKEMTDARILVTSSVLLSEFSMGL